MNKPEAREPPATREAFVKGCHRAARQMALLMGWCESCCHDLVRERGVWVCLNPECEAEKEQE